MEDVVDMDQDGFKVNRFVKITQLLLSMVVNKVHLNQIVLNAFLSNLSSKTTKIISMKEISTFTTESALVIDHLIKLLLMDQKLMLIFLL